jgi:hypothetical protein
VVNRWHRLFPPQGSDRKPLPKDKLEELAEQRAGDAEWVSGTRQRLSSLGWFMKCLKEPLARMANKQDGCTGAFFEGRYKSIAVLDEEALLAVCAYIDLNPVAAGLAPSPETSPFTSAKQRVEHVQQQGRSEDLKAALLDSVAGSRAAGQLEESLWLIPIEDRRRLDSAREGMLETFTLGNYLLLVEHTGRMFREGKAQISSELEGILERIGSSSRAWESQMRRLQGRKLIGNFIAGSRERLREAAHKLGVQKLANLSAVP